MGKGNPSSNCHIIGTNGVCAHVSLRDLAKAVDCEENAPLSVFIWMSLRVGLDLRQDRALGIKGCFAITEY